MTQPTSPWIPRDVRIRGFSVILEPLQPYHEPQLAAAVGDLNRQWWTSTPSAAGLAEDIAGKITRRDRGEMIPFAITLDDPTRRAVGVTCFYDLAPDVPRLSIGYTWIAEELWGTAVNPDVKRALLSYAFEELGCVAVEIRTKGYNAHSQRAIEKLGFTRDGVLRHAVRHRNGQLDNAVVYSALDSQWPEIDAALRRRLGSPQPPR